MGRACSLPSPPRYAPGGAAAFWGPGKARPQNQRRGRGPRPLAAPLRALRAPAAPQERCGLLRPPGPSFPATPPGTTSISCALLAHPFPQLPRYRFDFLYPLRVPPPFPLHNPPYPKSLLETAEGGFQGRAIRSPWRSAPYTLCIPGRGPLPFRSPLPLRNFSGVWGGAAPSRGLQGRGRPWPWRSQCRPLPCLHTKRPPLGAWHRKPSPLGGLSLKNP